MSLALLVAQVAVVTAQMLAHAISSEPGTAFHLWSLTGHVVQGIADAGLYHPTINSSLAARVAVAYSPADYPSDDMRAAGFVCGCGDYYNNPCRAEFRKVNARALPPAAGPCWQSQNMSALPTYFLLLP